jgi:uncharacterized membrane protein
MKELLVTATEYAVVFIDFLALIIIVFGTIEVAINVVRIVLGPPNGHLRRDIWLRYARWLVAGLTFQLASDIIESSIMIEWEAVGRLAAIAVIRTFLNYFLERDLNEVRDRQHVE